MGGINLFTYLQDNPVNGADPLGLYDLWDFGADTLGFAAGLGHAVSFGGSTWIAKQLLSDDDADVLSRAERCSGAFLGGEWASFALGGARVAYAVLAKLGSAGYAAVGATMENAAAASALRNTLKKAFRLNPWSQYRIYPFERMVEKYGTAAAIIKAAGRTDRVANVVGAVAAAGGATTILTTGNCGCK